MQYTLPVRFFPFSGSRHLSYIQASAGEALILHGKELEPGHSMSVLLSNPERKKERTDQDANEREIYVAGLSRFTTQIDLEKLFKTVGDLRTNSMMAPHGYSFVVWYRQGGQDDYRPRRQIKRLCIRRIRGRSTFNNRLLHLTF